MEKEVNSEPKYRVRLTQGAKGIVRFEFSCRGETQEEIDAGIKEMLESVAKVPGIEQIGGIL